MFSIVTCDLSVQLSCSVVLDTLWPHGCKTSGFPVHHQLPEFTQTHPLSWWCHPPISSSVVPFSPAFNLSQYQGLFQSVSSSHQVAKVLEFQHQSFQWIFHEYSGLISLRADWLDLLAVQGTLKSLLQQHSSKASIFQHSAFFIVQLISTHDYWENHSFD